MNKRQIHHYWTRLRAIKTWQLLVIGGFFVVLSVVGLRDNNLKMIKLRDAVVAADQQDGDVEAALRALREHIYSHMNTDPGGGTEAIRPPIQLKFRYERLVKAEKDRLATANSKIYTDAQATCEAQFPVGLSGSGRIPCIEAYVTQHGVQEKPIPDSLYKFDFLSPRWSPDLAGLSMVASFAFGALAIVRFAAGRWAKKQL